jgi:hypothetical protein
MVMLVEVTLCGVKLAAFASCERSETANKNAASTKILNKRLFIEVPDKSRLYYINPV